MNIADSVILDNLPMTHKQKRMVDDLKSGKALLRVDSICGAVNTARLLNMPLDYVPEQKCYIIYDKNSKKFYYSKQNDPKIPHIISTEFFLMAGYNY